MVRRLRCVFTRHLEGATEPLDRLPNSKRPPVTTS